MTTSNQATVDQLLVGAIVEKSHDSIAITNSRGVLLQVSPQFVSIYGGEIGDYQGRSVFELEQMLLTGELDAVTDNSMPGRTNSTLGDSAPFAMDSPETLPEALNRLERQMLADAKSKAKSTYEIARLLGISQPSVVRKLRKHRL